MCAKKSLPSWTGRSLEREAEGARAEVCHVARLEGARFWARDGQAGGVGEMLRGIGPLHMKAHRSFLLHFGGVASWSGIWWLEEFGRSLAFL